MQNNFKYIDDMIRNGQREIILDSNIILDDGEESEYLEGIEVDLDFIVIDGCGHTIDARGKARIFNCIARRITLKNITFKNGQSFNNHDDAQNDNGGAIKINPGCTIRIVNCQFTGNASQNKAGAIFNLGEAEIDKSSFTEKHLSEIWRSNIECRRDVPI